MPDQPISSESQYFVGLIAEPDSALAGIQRSLATSFRLRCVNAEQQIVALLEEPQLRAILLDLDSIEGSAEDAAEVLTEIRQVREDVVLVAFSRSTSRSLPVKASRAGADEFFLSPANPQELQIVLTRAIEKRALEMEGRRLVD